MSDDRPDHGARLAASAAGLIGVRYRLHGRDPRFGLDCLGLVTKALELCGLPPPETTAYGLRNASIGHLIAIAPASGFVEVAGPVKPGDLLLTRPGPGQHHLLIGESGNSFIHAHAGLGMVARLAGPLPWPVEKHWRLDHRI